MTKVIRGKDIAFVEWTEYVEVFASMMVRDAGEEEITLKAVARAAELGVDIQPHWTPESLRHEINTAERIAACTSRPRQTNWLGNPAIGICATCRGLAAVV